MEELFSIIPDLPGVRVFCFGEERHTPALAKYCEEKGHYLEIVVFDDDTNEALGELAAKVRRIDEAKERYNLRSMLFDTVFVPIDIEKLADKEQFFRKIYRMMKNAGDLIVLISPSKNEEMEAFLQKLNYVAINPIELHSGLIAMTAKKMHGWTKV